MAVNTSKIEPLPHQVTAVYEEMLPRQPLRFLLADDPGDDYGRALHKGAHDQRRFDLMPDSCTWKTGRTMAGRTVPKLNLPFDILNGKSSRTGNFFNEMSHKTLEQLDSR